MAHNLSALANWLANSFSAGTALYQSLRAHHAPAWPSGVSARQWCLSPSLLHDSIEAAVSDELPSAQLLEGAMSTICRPKLKAQQQLAAAHIKLLVIAWC